MSVLMRIVPISQLFSSNRDSTEFLSQAAGMFKAYEDPGWDDDLTIGHRYTGHGFAPGWTTGNVSTLLELCQQPGF